MEKIDHIGIAVVDLKQAIAKYEKVLDRLCYKTESVISENVKTAFLRIGESKIELLEAMDKNGPIADFLARRGEGVHHIAYEVIDIYSEIERFKAQGFRVLNDKPRKGADNKLVCFIHPKDCHGVLTELVQSIK
ncbi:methylmalonyl-CoA epimerase [Albibacterium profundi]|uniref:Methylmalonyl-CoA epimerase n=1 Tax=Albibacterium profundi TaxID=3134906 RepID=A0ABV5CH54_9SPHI